MANLTVKFTKKDIFLLYALIIGVLLFLFFNYIYMPSRDELDELEFAIEDAQTKQLEMQTTIMRYQATLRDYEETQENLKELLKDIFPMMEGYEIDWFFTQMIKNYSLEPLLFSVSERPNYLTISPYVNSEIFDPTINSSLTTAEISVSTITIKVSGERSNMEALLDHIINDQPSMRVVSYNYDTKLDTTLNINIDLYMTHYSNGD